MCIAYALPIIPVSQHHNIDAIIVACPSYENKNKIPASKDYGRSDDNYQNSGSPLCQ